MRPILIILGTNKKVVIDDNKNIVNTYKPLYIKITLKK